MTAEEHQNSHQLPESMPEALVQLLLPTPPPFSELVRGAALRPRSFVAVLRAFSPVGREAGRDGFGSCFGDVFAVWPCKQIV